MGLFSMSGQTDINEGVREYSRTDNAVLLDVRTAREYAEGHIPGSINIPFQEIDRIREVISGKAIHIFTYCLSGARSAQAQDYLVSHGYPHVKNIGGISSYRGVAEK